MAASFKAFLTESQAEELRLKKQEEWERIRKPTDPLGASC
jgi:hypothetical protein